MAQAPADKNSYEWFLASARDAIRLDQERSVEFLNTRVPSSSSSTILATTASDFTRQTSADTSLTSVSSFSHEKSHGKPKRPRWCDISDDDLLEACDLPGPQADMKFCERVNQEALEMKRQRSVWMRPKTLHSKLNYREDMSGHVMIALKAIFSRSALYASDGEQMVAEIFAEDPWLSNLAWPRYLLHVARARSPCLREQLQKIPKALNPNTGEEHSKDLLLHNIFLYSGTGQDYEFTRIIYALQRVLRYKNSVRMGEGVSADVVEWNLEAQQGLY